MKIKKIYIQNFKWIKDKRIIELDKDITFLTWPNGFWKTTIFDVIELCLTWEIHRTFQKEHVTNDNKDYVKPFYQNTKWKDVIIKLWLEKAWEDFIIVKFLNKEHSWTSKIWKIKNKVSDFELIETYLDKTENFDDEIFNINNKEKLNSDEINSFLGLENSEEISKLYPLFNYLQQEETTYFLKKSENERKKELDFLFNTKKEWSLEEQINNFLKRINSITKSIKVKIDKKDKEIKKQEENIKNKEKVEYKSFFDKSDEINTRLIEFDSQELFNNNIENKEEYYKNYIDNLSNIQEFLKNFSIDEYNEDRKKTDIQKIRNDKIFIESFILQKYNTDKEFRKLEKHNEIYDLSKKNYYLEFLIYEKYLEKEEIERLKEKNYLYGLCNTDKYDSSLECFILQNQLDDKDFLEEWRIKYNLIQYVDTNSNLLDQFLLEKFDDNRIRLEEDYNNFNNIKNDDENIIIKWFLLNSFFYKKDNYSKSKYEELEEKYDLYKKIEKYIDYKKDEKLIFFNEIYKLLEFDDDKLLDNFKVNKNRKDELESDLRWNNKIISELNELRRDLINSFQNNNNLEDFDNSCLLCWTKKVNNTDIINFKIFKELVKEKTDNIKKLSNWKTDKIEEINKKINENILELEKEIDLFINDKLNKESVENFNNLKKYLTQEKFDLYEIKINSLFEDNKEYKNEQNIFENFEDKVNNLKKYFKDKYIDWFNLFTVYKKLEWRDEPFLDKNILNNFLKDVNINFNIEKEGFNEIKYNEVKSIIIKSLNDYLKWFTSDNNMYVILNSYANWNSSSFYKENIEKINNFFKTEEVKKDFLIKEKSYEYNIDLNLFKSKLKKYILNNTEDSSQLYNKIYNLKKGEKFIDKNKYELLKNELISAKINFKLEKIEDYNNDYEENSIISLEDKIYKIFKNRILIYQKLDYLQKEKINNYDDLLDKYKFEEIKKYILNNYENYSNFDNYKDNIITFLNNKYNNIEISKIKLWWEYSDFLNVIFNKDTSLIEKYQKIKFKLEDKKKYVEYKYFEVENNLLNNKKEEYKILKNRLELLEKNKTKKLKDIYTNEINKHKSAMIEWIKIPFYLYTAKILQNFQQWMWIFIVFDWEKSIRFYTEWDSNHDAMHHLSSWQLAVVSIAFTLAVNTVYKISEELRFLNIDDPVQEMDSLNIHSFIELIRHNFMDYKLIISTHNDENAYFMKYKIEKIKENSVKMINVQSKFFNSK